jgi:hypothetical protein
MSRSTARLAVLALLLTACAIPGRQSKIDNPPGAMPEREISRVLPTATDMAFTATYEIRFGDELVGYLVEVMDVPEGIDDQRGFPPGTSIIQDTELSFVGFITPGGRSYRFDDHGDASAVGFGNRDKSIATFFRKNGYPTLVSIHQGTVMNS